MEINRLFPSESKPAPNTVDEKIETLHYNSMLLKLQVKAARIAFAQLRAYISHPDSEIGHIEAHTMDANICELQILYHFIDTLKRR